ncbi:AAA family ATPase [uncultured Methanobrevibacter sp.]|uniref:AAA family ATPase n=1 Tax=uncultured Methanobrevibacter sp. TaxID=253161 RepID=UPI0025D80035|nr:AAA family ATPase [uncultured Methanobrevibacter sp.]
MARKGLGKGLDSLIPNFYDEDFDSNATQSLEDMLVDNDEPSNEENDSQENKNIFDEVEEEVVQEEDDGENVREEVKEEIQEEETDNDDETSEVLSGDDNDEESVQTLQEIQVDQKHIDEVKEIVNKNPRITLWSSRSSAVFRYLRKTEPEFSISKEASTLIDEAVSKKYPEIWELFDDC